MKALVTSISVSVALLAGTAAIAQQSADTQEPAVTLSPVQVRGPDSHRLSADELREFQGQYALEDGTTLTVVRKNRRLFMDVTGQPEVELVATSANSFVTRTDATEVTFQQAANANVFGVQLRPSGEKVVSR